MKRTLLTAVIVLGALVALGALIIGTGAYNVAADEPHTSLVVTTLELARERSIAVRADEIKVPPLDDPAMARRGAGNYDAMCVGCHLAPGKEDSELSVGLYPAPPKLTEHAHVDAAEAFWVIKHGIKATGMPAWGRRMDDPYIWDLVAFLRKLPTLSAEQYTAEVAASGGHSHGGGESTEHDHAERDEHDEGPSDRHTHDEAEQPHDHAADHADSKVAGTTTHAHADGEEHAHEAPAGTPVAAAQALHEALSSGNASAVEKLLDPNVLILEGGNAERSRQE